MTSQKNQRRASPVVKRSVVINGHKTSVSLEEPFWTEIKAIAAERKVVVAQLIAETDANRGEGNLSSALRLFVLAKYRSEAVGAAARVQGSQDRLPQESAPPASA